MNTRNNQRIKIRPNPTWIIRKHKAPETKTEGLRTTRGNELNEKGIP